MANSCFHPKTTAAATGLVVALLFSTMAHAQDNPKEAFATKAAQSNTFEIEAAKLVVERGKDDGAKAFARDMITEHTKTAADLEAAAIVENIKLPTGLDDEHSKKLAALKSASEADFDQAYLSTQVTAHEEAVALFTSYAKDGPDGSLKAFAALSTSTLRTHAIRVHGLTNK